MKEQLLRSTEQKEGQSVLTNTLRVLTWIAESTSKTVGVREIAKALSMQPSTVSRILKTLVKEGLVSQEPRDKGYKLGLELLRLGVLAAQKLNLRTIAKPYMNELVQQTNEDAVLGVYDPNRQEMLRVEQVHSGHPLRYVIETGYTFPLPLGSDLSCSIRTRDSFYTVRDELFSIFKGEVQSQQNFPTHHRLYYGQYALDTLKAWQEGREPIADLNDLYKAMIVVDKIYSSKETLRLGKHVES